MLYPAELRGQIEDCGTCPPWRDRPFAIPGSLVALARMAPGHSPAFAQPPAELRGRSIDFRMDACEPPIHQRVTLCFAM